MKLIQNIECGNIFEATTEGLREARLEAQELYDIGDPHQRVELLGLLPDYRGVKNASIFYTH